MQTGGLSSVCIRWRRRGSPALNQTPACLQLAFLGEDAERDVVDLLGTARPARLEWRVGDEDRRRLVGSGKALGTARFAVPDLPEA